MILELPIGKSNYKISCQASERKKLSYLAEKLNKRLNRLSSQIENVDEQTLLAIAALMMEDELENIENQDDSDEGMKLNEQDLYDTVSETIENIADHVEKMTKKIQNY